MVGQVCAPAAVTGGPTDADSFFGAGVGVVVSLAIPYFLRLDFPCLRIFIALHADSLPRALSSTSIRRSSLTPDGKTANVADSSIGPNRLQTFQVSLDISPEIAFYQ